MMNPYADLWRGIVVVCIMLFIAGIAATKSCEYFMDHVRVEVKHVK
jgi:hypothetical protein